MNVGTGDLKESGAKLETHQLSRIAFVSGIGYENKKEMGESPRKTLQHISSLIFLKPSMEN